MISVNVAEVLGSDFRHDTNRHLRWITQQEGQCGVLLGDGSEVPCEVCGVPSTRDGDRAYVTFVKRTLPMCYLSNGHAGGHEGCGPAGGLDSVVTWTGAA